MCIFFRESIVVDVFLNSFFNGAKNVKKDSKR